MARWLFAGPAERGAEDLATRLGILPEQTEGHGFVPTGGRPAAHAGGRAAYAAALATRGDPATAWDALVYQPPLFPAQGATPSRPQTSDADDFFTACAEAFSAVTPPRLVLLSSTAAYTPSHHNVGYLGETAQPAPT